MEIQKYTNSAWTDLGEPMKAFDEYTDTAMSLPLTIQTSSVNAVENYKVFGASGGVGEATSGSEPAGYKIPVSLTDGTSTSNYDLFVGNSKLNEDEYIDYETQKVYKRTANSLNFDELIAAPSGTMPMSSGTFEHVLALQLKPSTTYTMYSDGQGAESGDADANRSVYFCGSRAGNTVFNDHSVSYETDSSGMIYIGINSSRTNAQQYINGTAHLWILEGSDAQGDYVPYYSPVDPPLPFPVVETTIGKTEVDVNTTTAPEKVILEYKGWKQAGTDGEVKYRHNNEWANSAPPAKPSWLADGYEAVLDAQTAPSDYYCDLAYIDNDVQFVYRVYAQPEVSCKIEKSNNYLTVYQDPYTVGYNGFTTYGARYNGSSWYLASSTLNKNGGPTAYANGTSQRAILASTITNLVNASGMTFEDYR